MKLFCTSALVSGIVAVASPVWADITASQVLEEWRAIAAKSGQQLIVGSESMDGDTLVLSDFSSVISLPEFQITVSTDWINLREMGNGAVEVTMAPVSNLLGDIDGGNVVVMGHTEQENLNFIVSGETGNIALDFVLGSYSLQLDKLTVRGRDIDANLQFNISEMQGDYAVNSSEGTYGVLSGQYDLGGFDVSFSARPPVGDGFAVGNLSASDLSATYTGDLISVENIEQIMTSGSGINLEFEVQTNNLQYDGQFADGGTKFAVKGSEDSSEFGMSISPLALSYHFARMGGLINVISSEIPFPFVEMEYGEVGLDLAVPLGGTEEPQDFAVKVALRDIAISDMIWNIFDPGETLPRDPATAAVDVTGTVNMLANLMNIGEVATLDGPPAMPESLSLNELLVSFGGAEITGEGAFTFNPDNLETFDGIPQPIGKVDLSLRGGFGLLDSLTALGLVPTDASFGIRAMLGAFASPGDDADHFVSTIELTPDGAVMANGQRIR